MIVAPALSARCKSITEATHQLEGRGQASLAGSKSSYHRSHSCPDESRTGSVVSKVQMRLTTEATHQLEPRTGVVGGSKCSCRAVFMVEEKGRGGKAILITQNKTSTPTPPRMPALPFRVTLYPS